MSRISLYMKYGLFIFEEKMKLAQTVFLKQSFFDRHKNHKEILTNKAGRPYLSFIIECQCTIDKKEWVELNKNLMTIVTNFTEYLKKFATSIESNTSSKLPIFKFSSLQYFIEEVKSVVKSL